MNTINDQAAILRKRRKARLLGSAVALGLAGAFTAQTIAPQGFALADPVHVEAPAPANFSAVVSAVQPAVVSVRVKTEAQPEAMSFNGFDGLPGFEDLPKDHPLYRFFRRFGEDGNQGQQQNKRAPKRYGQSQGSGFFISDDGYLVTNEHVVSHGEEFTVVMDDGTEYDAKLIGSDERSDLALLKVDAERTFTYVEFADDAPAVGEWVVAIGNPFGLGGSVTAGIVSARGRDIGAGPYDDFIQIDAPVNRGNSGGPAFNVNGQVIGVNAAIFSPSGGNVGIAFAIPASTARTIVADLRDDGTVVRGWLGVQIQPVSQDIADSIGLKAAKGAIVAEPQADSPAIAAGIRSGDTILKVDGKEVEGPRELAKMIAGYAPDTKVDVTIWRDGEEKDVEVTLGKLPETRKAAAEVSPTGKDTAVVESLGVELASAKSAGAGDEGVVVTEVDPDGPAAEKGLKAGDVILEVAGEAVETPGDVAEAVVAASEKGRKAVLLRVKSDQTVRFVALPVEKA
ncbi:Do family serine endopeptidase [Stappia sp. F7233]|uniref:Probable periplasmic serine endoprotease DegP-like n=1 Tax=Stappia albiluteola TaxID=2758565 RepID=A0A839ABJ6_9HYPH|nr:Do family serine endopeptidase [Stappia albiluteola]MBA5776384.1 Do family serine endopeptidase [Stappia albiluteola]